MDNGTGKDGQLGVRRITVDGRIHDELIRIVVAKLKSLTERVALHSLDVWTREQERHVTPKTLQSALGISKDPSSLAGALSQVREKDEGSMEGTLAEQLWRELREGQVYLSGAFELVPPEAPAFIRPAGTEKGKRSPPTTAPVDAAPLTLVSK
jgi:hypothetical protein